MRVEPSLMHPEGGSWTRVRTHTPSKFSKVLHEPLAPIPLDHSKFRENGSQPPPYRTRHLSRHPALQFPVSLQHWPIVVDVFMTCFTYRHGFAFACYHGFHPERHFPFTLFV